MACVLFHSPHRSAWGKMLIVKLATVFLSLGLVPAKATAKAGATLTVRRWCDLSAHLQVNLEGPHSQPRVLEVVRREASETETASETTSATNGAQSGSPPAAQAPPATSASATASASSSSITVSSSSSLVTASSSSSGTSSSKSAGHAGAAPTSSGTPAGTSSQVLSSSSPSLVATATASGSGIPSASGPVIRLGVSNWTRIESSGKGCGPAWGGLGGGNTQARLRYFEIPLTGEDDSWAETFRYTTFEAGGDILKGDIPEWAGWNDTKAEVTNKISETYRVSGVLADSVRRRADGSATSISGVSLRKMQTSR